MRGYIPVAGDFDLFVYAALFAIIVYLVGIVAALVIKDVGSPSPAALTSALVVALVAAAFAKYGMDLVPQIPNSTISKRGLVLAGAVIGYMFRR